LLGHDAARLAPIKTKQRNYAESEVEYLRHIKTLYIRSS
jgi:hypothetical protein